MNIEKWFRMYINELYEAKHELDRQGYISSTRKNKLKDIFEKIPYMDDDAHYASHKAMEGWWK